MAKSWIGKEYYVEYLKLKENIAEISNKIRYCRRRGFDEMEVKLQEELETLVKKFRTLLNQLKLEGVNIEDLILVGLGVELEIF